MAIGRYGKKVVVSKSRREKKDTKMIRIYNEVQIGETIDGEKVIKVVNHFGKKYAVVKRS